MSKILHFCITVHGLMEEWPYGRGQTVKTFTFSEIKQKICTSWIKIYRLQPFIWKVTTFHILYYIFDPHLIIPLIFLYFLNLLVKDTRTRWRPSTIDSCTWQTTAWTRPTKSTRPMMTRMPVKVTSGASPLCGPTSKRRASIPIRFGRTSPTWSSKPL